MKKIFLLTTLLITSLSFTTSVLAAKSEVTWTDYESYTDIKGSQSLRGEKFRESVFKALEGHFANLAADLPENETLKIKVTNLDLAGDTRIGGISDIRVITERYPPAINFSYQLLDTKGNSIKSEDVELRNVGYMTGRTLKYRNKIFAYEKEMLDEWFKSTFEDSIAKQ
ncbi:DUF3016 domain-containing protein [Colwellia sp. E2M01]|uniref:DUF3016 domain-containing protein n=1 Tax=Colwellia sp. E2M01 TaxID=2841561 RepID=UPI001C08E627|nr:DUF3016 domain-containing protein [Colwellia sp. E2M01]MBU2870749.1 DUF3016 domain-containing protein [Colwellia sp. E2M01]